MKRYIILFALSFASYSYGNLLDDWSNDELCGWMESASTPEYIQTEVLKREVICYGGVEASSLPNDKVLASGNGTVFPSPDPALIEKLKSTYSQGVEQVMGSSY
jgi:hypothetical protein